MILTFSVDQKSSETQKQKDILGALSVRAKTSPVLIASGNVFLHTRRQSQENQFFMSDQIQELCQHRTLCIAWNLDNSKSNMGSSCLLL